MVLLLQHNSGMMPTFTLPSFWSRERMPADSAVTVRSNSSPPLTTSGTPVEWNEKVITAVAGAVGTLLLKPVFSLWQKQTNRRLTELEKLEARLDEKTKQVEHIFQTEIASLRAQNTAQAAEISSLNERIRVLQDRLWEHEKKM